MYEFPIYSQRKESKEGIVTLPITKVSGRNLYLKVSYKGTGCFHLRLPQTVYLKS